MTNRAKINCLVIPDLFPDHEKDIKGIFMLDYLESTKNLCANTTLVMKLYGSEQGFVNTKINGSNILKYTFHKNKVPAVLKAFSYLRYISKGYKLCKSIPDVDIIHAHGSILSGTIALLTARKRKIPFVVTEHAGPFSIVTSNTWKFKWTKYILERANVVLNVSEHAQNDILKSGIAPKRKIVTYNPVNTDKFRISEKKEKSFLFFSRLDHFKGALRCLTIFNALRLKYPDWKFVVIGEGEDLAPMQELIKANPGLATQVELKGQLKREAIIEQMAKSAFLIFPSLHETFGLVAAEALACGVPVIATNKTAPKEFVTNKNGLLVDPLNNEEISQAIEYMIANYQIYNPVELRNSIVSRFGLDSFGERLYSIYLDTISNFKH